MQMAELSSPGVSPHHQVVMKKLKLGSSLKEYEDNHTQHGAFLFPHILCSQVKSQSMPSKNRTIRKRKLNTHREQNANSEADDETVCFGRRLNTAVNATRTSF
jgi:hypothetical protein